MISPRTRLLMQRTAWVLVMESARWQCQCKDPSHPDHRGRRCSTRMTPPDLRQPAEPGQDRPAPVELLAAPKDPTRRPRKGEFLYAWCPDCYQRTVKALRRIQKAYDRQQLADAQEQLFSLEEL